MRQMLWVDQPVDCLEQRDAGRDEDRRNDSEACELLTTGAPQEERDPEGDRGQGIAGIVNQIREERDGTSTTSERSSGPRLRCGRVA